MDGSANDALSRLVPDVLNFATPQFELKSDLQNLVVVQRVAANEAVVFYSSRILEALTAEAIRRLGQTPSVNVFSNLEMLWYWNRFGVATRSWAHALRRLGNTVRHLSGRIGPSDAALAAAFAEGWIVWFFGEFSHGNQLPKLTVDQRPIIDGVLDDLLVWMQQLEKATALPPAPMAAPTAVVPAVTAELLISRGEFDAAFELLQTSLASFRDDLRLLQLQGLCWSRKGELDRAIQSLEPVRQRQPADEETLGILAGAYKRRWLKDEANKPDLELAYQTYRTGWKGSAKGNTYLGINTAATALWLGNQKLATETAAEVENVLKKRIQSLPAELRDSQESYDFWDRITLAESRLIQGDADSADRIYEAAFAKHAELLGDIAVSRKQREIHLRWAPSFPTGPTGPPRGRGG